MQPDLSTLAATVGRQALDLNVYAGFLQAALAGSLPAEYLSVERARSLFRRGDQPITAVSVTLGEYRYRLERSSPTSPPRSTITHHVGGIDLRTEPVPLAEWSGRIAAALADLARTNADTAAVLARVTSYDV